MAHNTEQVGFPAIPLNAGMQIRIRALSPTADSTVSGVVFQQWAIYGYDESDQPEGPEVAPPYSLDTDEDVALGLPHA